MMEVFNHRIYKIFGEGDLIEGYCSEFEALNRAREAGTPEASA